MRALFLLIAFLLTALRSQSGFAAEVSANFEAANRLYEQGKFTDAIAAYEEILKSNKAPVIYFNLGNACYKAGLVGRAIAAYRNAEQLAPRDPDLRANLQFVLARVQGPRSDHSVFETWFRKLTLNEWTALAAVPFWLCLLLLAAIQIKPAWRQTLRGWILTSGIATLAFAALLFAAWKINSNQTAVVIAREAVVRNGPLDESPATFNVHDGAELHLLDHKDDWVQVRVGNRVGWIRNDQITLVTRG
jgi:Tetratricopeptide repeat./Bacterial SH3 domain.